MVGSMIATYIGGSLVTAGAVAGTTVLTTAGMAAAFAINFAVSTIVTRTFADNPEGQQDSGVREQVPPSGVNAIPIVYGDAYMGGTFVDAVLSTDQKCMYYVLAISSISPNGQFTFDTTDMYYGDRRIVFGTDDTARVDKLVDDADNEDNKMYGRLYIGLYTSNAAGVITPVNWYAPDVVMAETFAGFSIPADQVWPSTGRQMYGTAFAIVRLEYNQDAGTTNLAPITFKVKQALNGTGVAKPGDVWYDYITSKYYGGAVGWLPDGSFDSSFVDASSATALNAYSDELITFDDYEGNPQTQSRYRINGVLDAGQSVLSNIDRIMTACDSWMTYNSALGQWSVVINKAEATAYAFNDNNIIGEIRVSASDITSSINQIEARFPFKENRDQASFVNIETPTALLYPNEPVNKYSITYDLVNDSVQANYLANRLLEQAREDLIVSFSTTYYGIQVNAGDVVSVTNSDYGWNAKLFRVIRVNEASLPDGSLGAKLEMSEYSSAVYDNFDITQYTPVPNSGLPSANYFSALSAPTVTGYPSASVPNFAVQTTIPTTGRVTYLTLFYTTSATPSATDWQQLSTATTSNSSPITNGTTYTFSDLQLSDGTYYFAYVVGNDIGRSTLSTKSSAFVWTPTANTGPFVDISGFTGFSKSTAGVITPTTATLNAVVRNVTSPTYSWSVTGATPTSGTASSITITPTSVATSVVVVLTVNGSNLSSAISQTITMPIVSQGATGASGTQAGVAIVYQWATTIPTISGTSTYTWASGAVSSPPTGWFTTISNTGTAGQTLWAAKVSVSAPVTDTTTSFSWTSASIVPFGYVGTTGASARTAYTATNTTLNTTPNTYTVSGDNVPATGSWGSGIVWATTVPTLSSGQSVWQTDGVYNPTNSQTIWGVPYLSSLKVGNLAAISTNTGNLTVTGTFQSNTAAISGTTMTGSGGVLYPTGRFAFGSSTGNITYNGTNVTMNGAVTMSSLIASNTASAGYLNILNTNNVLQVTRTVATLLPASYIYDQASNATAVPAFTVLDTTSSIVTNLVTFSGYATGGITLQVSSNGSSSGAAKFFNNNSSKQFWAAPGLYSAYSPSGGGKIYIVDGNGPFTGFHDTLTPIENVVKIGDIMVDTQLIYKDGISSTLFEVAPSSQPNQAAAIGIASGVVPVVQGTPAALWVSTTNEGEFGDSTTWTMQSGFDPAVMEATYKVVQVNALGEGQVNVCGENGDIAVGDLIVTSSMAGKGMKQADDLIHSYTVAKAREAATFSSPTDVQMIACIYVSG